jgi:uncharacterized protein (TIGR02996 family)
MTQGEAIFQCILDNPEDDTPRLVYADWLDEHGDPDRAEFIRVQIELARLAPDAPRREALSARESELLKANALRWDACLGPLAGKIHPWYRRGMPEELVLPQGVGDDDLPYLQQLPTLRALGLYESAVTDEGLLHLRGLDNLLGFSPGKAPVTDAALPHLLALPRLVVLVDDEERLSEGAKAEFRRLLPERFLRLSAGGRRAAAVQYVSHQDFRFVSAQQPVREVVIHDRSVFDEDMIFFTALPELELLDIHEAPSLTSAGLVHLAGLRNLRSLSLSATGVTSIEPLAGLTHIECLCLCLEHDCRPLGLGSAAVLARLTNLRELKLLWCDVTDEFLARLAHLERLEVLEVSGMHGRLTDEGLNSLRGLSQLRVLKLEEHPGITDAGLAHLARLNHLECLDLSQTGVSDGGLVHLRGVKGLECLVVCNTAVTEAGARVLSESLPKVTIAVGRTVVKSSRGAVVYTQRDIDGQCSLEIGDHWEVRKWEVGSPDRVSITLREEGFRWLDFVRWAEVHYWRKAPEGKSARDLLMEVVANRGQTPRLGTPDEDVRPLSDTDIASQRHYSHDTPYLAFAWVRAGRAYLLDCSVTEERWAEWEPAFLRLAHSFCWTD